MKFDVKFADLDLKRIPETARRMEALGFDGVWSWETANNPFLSLALAAEHTGRISLGTAIAVAFPRSPMLTAQVAWDLAALSEGRFILGLGTQVKAHNERRFSTPWFSPGPRLREVVQAIRAIWDCWQNGTRLDFQGEYYQFTLMTPFFDPGPIPHPDIPIYIAGTNPYLCRLAGEVADGIHIHPFHSVKYIREVVVPNVQAGAASQRRDAVDIQLASAIFCVTGDSSAQIEAAKASVRSQIAFYASTPTYRIVLDCHGWGDVSVQLSHLARAGKWGELGTLINDEMLEQYAVIAPRERLAQEVQARYGGLLDRVGFYEPFRPGEADEWWRRAAESIRS